MGLFAEHFYNGFDFGDVAYWGRCAVHVDVVDVFGLHACVFEGVAHREDGAEAFGVGCGEVICVSAHASAGYFGVDLGAAGFGVFEFFEDEHYRAFAHDEAVARGAEGA